MPIPSAIPSHPIGDWTRARFDAPWSGLINAAFSILAIIAFASLSAMFLVWLERKVCARFQARLGPTRVGPFGLLQPVADAIKLLLKEGLRPRASEPFAYYLAPLLPISASFLILAVIPFDVNLQVANPEGGVLYVSAVSGLGVFGLLIGGWASNNKYSMLGSMRSGAQIISYEISLILGMLLIVMVSGTASLRGIVLSQQGTIWDWWIFKLPGAGLLAFLFFLVASTAELNRGPFDMSEAESELTGGFHTEYAGISFSMFFLAEYINMFIAGALGTVLFLGGFLAPQTGWSPVDGILSRVPGYVWFLLKSYGILFLFMWFRWTFPRLRIDQLMALEWKFLLPATLANLLLAGALYTFGIVLP